MNNSSAVCCDMNILCSKNPENYDEVFITDSEDVYNNASKDIFFIQILSSILKIKVLRYLFDGFYNINPTWRSVLHLDTITERKRRFYVDGTLILHCRTTEGYENVIPFIHGPYSRVILHGKITWSQVKRLIGPDVRQIRIAADFEIVPEDYDDFVKFMSRQLRNTEDR
uniref:BPH_3 domain-containing protein n=1 Tax=Panagrellus redivivus TaxID=6233 RepID=A0A7E4VK63_PANRE